MYSVVAPPYSILQSSFPPSRILSSTCGSASHGPHHKDFCERDGYAPAPRGLRTPPRDENMGTAYQMPTMASYENHHPAPRHQPYAPAAAASDRPRPVLNERPAPNELVFHRGPACFSQTTQTQQARTLSQPRESRVSNPPARPSTPTSVSTVAGQEISARDSAMVLHSLQIPECISPKGGNLADFVAELTALFWFESIQVLEVAEKIRTVPPGAPVRRISDSAKASRNFKKWVQSVLSTTQVTQNVILLALLFIYRLKMINPGVKGRQGSEYRLFTVALMLGNKFLDDNTYTNKTWADVSGISVNEIHVMEVEFLSNMRYSLLASKEEWEEWLTKLAKLWELLERAQRSASPSPVLVPSPAHQRFTSPLPSPTGTLQLISQPQNTFSPRASTAANNQVNGNDGSGGQSWAPYAANNAISPLALKPEPVLLHRKRSFPEEDPTEPPAKRMSRIPPAQNQLQFHPYSQVPPPPPPVQQAVPQVQLAPQRPAVTTPARPGPSSAPDHARLSLPNLTLNTSHAAAVPAQPYPAVSYAPPQASPLSLPPLVPGVRAMSTVFPPATTTFAAPHTTMPSSGPSLASHTATVTPTSAFPPTSYGTPTKRLSPQNALTPTAPYAGSSPLTDSFHHGSASGVHTPLSHSPSVYLQHRNSPYRPVRHVNTLLYPPPSAFLQQYHIANTVPPTQMHYQPLGRRNEFRTGIVPEFAMARAGHQGVVGGGQHHAMTGVGYQPPPQVLPDPNQGRPPYNNQPIGRPPHANPPYI